ncbi:aspartic proteinase 39 [Coffea arabica]|uniref:Aspartic proteinase 39 n=1 Tax=Coffea arabica TaxID=13443 RepID=A0A6P6SYK8_COFAR
MNLRSNGVLLLGLGLVVALLFCSGLASGNLVLKVQHRYGGLGHGRRSTLTAFKAHDVQRHRRKLAALDFPLGGDGRVTGSGLYYTKLAIGTPRRNFYVQVDTGSDILWVNCAGCDNCPKKSSLGIELAVYDLNDSKSGKQVTCDQDVCALMYNNQYSACKDPKPCEYSITYADKSTMSGFFVTDTIQFDQVTGNLQTHPNANGIVSFGCSVKQSGTQHTSTDRVSGIVGFGQANSSIISQLAESGKVKKTFSHCLDAKNGGGIFVIGQVVDPIVNSTALVADDGDDLLEHYNVMMKRAEIEGEIFDIPTESFFDTGRKTVIDSGATLAYFPAEVYDLIMEKVTARQSNFKTHIVEQQLKCFYFNGNIDDVFPTITFHFAGSVSMPVLPHEYFIHLQDNEWCIGFQRGGLQTQDGHELILLGDTILSNKLVVYDLENQKIGWTRYNCSSSIKVKDEVSGNVNSVNSPDISSAFAYNTGKALAALMFVATLAIQFY